MSYVLDHADATDVYIRRVEDGVIVGFNRPGIGKPSATETVFPNDIDLYFPPLTVPDPLSEIADLKVKVAALEAKQAAIERDIATLRKP